MEPHPGPAATAPSSRASAAQQAAEAAPAAGIGDLPEGVLVKVLSSLPLEERCAAWGWAANISPKHWDADWPKQIARHPGPGPAAAAHAACEHTITSFCPATTCRLGPVRQLDVRLEDSEALGSFMAWLNDRGEHLQRLTLECSGNMAEGGAAAAADLAACLSVAGAKGQLVELEATGCISSTRWLVTMRSLRRLVLRAQQQDSPLLVSPAISGLTALTSLCLNGRITFPPGAALPASIQHVTLADDEHAAFPELVSACVAKLCYCLKQLHFACNVCTSCNQLPP